MDIIFDIDGTLYDHNHRLKYLFTNPPDWERFKSDIHLDTKISEINDVLISLHKEHRIIFCTGRDRSLEEITISQILKLYEKSSIYINKSKILLYMRSVNDMRQDDAVKLDLLKDMQNDGLDPKVVFEDRKSVVNMWRKKGLICLQVAENDS
jgi:uncharacterized HAD superfamily protein